MSELRHLVSDNQVERLRMQRVRAHQTQQQQARHNEIGRIRRRNAPVILELAAFHYDPEIDYCADKSVTIGEMKIICKYCNDTWTLRTFQLQFTLHGRRQVFRYPRDLLAENVTGNDGYPLYGQTERHVHRRQH